MESRPNGRWVVGAMTGTSVDGIDVALVRIEGAGLAMTASVSRHEWRELGPLQPLLRDAAAGSAMTAGALATLAHDLGALHADLIAQLADGAAIDLVAAHGQTVYHAPPRSWQLLDPVPIARRLACPVVSDLRQADLAAGGRGAPITPLADWVLFRHAERRRAIVNLGGFCNVTVLPATPGGPGSEDRIHDVRGFDVCACNHVLDEVARRALGAPYDAGGAAARSGTVRPALAGALRRLLDAQSAAGRSMGSGDELARWVQDELSGEKRPAPPPADLAASAVEAIAGCIASAIEEAGGAEETLLAGGGAHNVALRDALSAKTGDPVRLDTEERPGALAAREATAMAVLGALCADRIPITLPQVTGCRAPAPVAGRWCYPP